MTIELLGVRSEMHRSAVQLPYRHLTIRVPWHDTGWEGTVCRSPAGNHACTILANIAENKDVDLEERSAGLPIVDLTGDYTPPCVLERVAFAANTDLSIAREHPYKFAPTHEHLAPTPVEIPPHTLLAQPFRWVTRRHAPEIAEVWGIDYDQDREDVVDNKAGYSPTWVEHHDNQLAMLDSFFSAIRPDESLAFIYAKAIPLVDDERTAGRRVLIGATTITHVPENRMWNEEREGFIHAAMWERALPHSLRRQGEGWKGGVVLPYQWLYDSHRHEDLLPYVALAPTHLAGEFSYVTEHLDHDGMIDALAELNRAVDAVSGLAPGDWDRARRWIDEQLNRVWIARGPYPGLGSVLTAAGIPLGTVAAMRIADAIDDGADPWPVVRQALTKATQGEGPLADLGIGDSATVFLSLPDARRELAETLSRAALSAEQAKRLWKIIDQADLTNEAVRNPYLMYELDRGEPDAVALTTTDRAVFVDSARRDRFPLPGGDITDPQDRRRVRAVLADILEWAAGQGHTLLPEDWLLDSARSRSLEPPCDPTADLLTAFLDDWTPVINPVSTADGDRAWKLDRYVEAAKVIRHQIQRRIDADRPIDLEIDWRSAVDEAIEEDVAKRDEFEEAGRQEKSLALQTLATTRFSVLVGPAGTGKTTLLKALCSIPQVRDAGVLLLAPTGKAVVQLQGRVGVPARTIASLLVATGRYDPKAQQYRITGGEKFTPGETVIVDESSMLTEDMLAALLDALAGVQRFILVGDHRQLPPIGAGRPFRDTVEYCRTAGTGLAELKIVRRQTGGGDDLRLAAWFATDRFGDLDEGVWARATADEGNVQFIQWSDQDELWGILTEVLHSQRQIEPGDPNSLQISLGATRKGNYANFNSDASAIEDWQILSPVRHRPGGVRPINQYVRETYRPEALRWASDNRRRTVAKPMGDDRVISGDKVIVLRNEWLRPYARGQGYGDERRLIANGEIGILEGPFSKARGAKKRTFVNLHLPSRPHVSFALSNWMFGERGDLVELAYAITIHKSQGSQCRTSILVLPHPCPIASPELLYTALTRQVENVIVLHQGDITDLRRLANPAASETAARLTDLYEPPDPVMVYGSDRPLDGRLIHRVEAGYLVRSKSEVVVANILHDVCRQAGIGPPRYEQWLHLSDGGHDLLPDFTITDDATGRTVLWEHLGMMDQSSYRRRWEEKKRRYLTAGWVPHNSEAASGADNVLATSDELAGIDAAEIRATAEQILLT